MLTSALDFDPNLRPQSASAMQKMLKEAIIQRPAPPPPPPVASSSSSSLRPWLVGVGILLLLVVLAGGSLLFGGAFGPPTSGNQATATEIVVATVTPEASVTEAPLPPTPQLVAGATRIAQKDGMVQVYVPAGDFEMGLAQDEPGVIIVSTDEKTGIQALERRAETKPMCPGSPERESAADRGWEVGEFRRISEALLLSLAS